MSLKTGKLPASDDPGALLYATYAKVADYPTKVPPPAGIPWGMLGNDTAGDCVFAGAGHETINWTHLVGKEALFSTPNTLADYSTVTGYVVGDESTDQGTDVVTALKYRRKTGIRDASGKRHKLGGYMALKQGDTRGVRKAVYDLRAVGVGIEFPETAMTQFNRGQAWSVVKGAQTDGGHYIPAIGYNDTYLYVVTWGRVQPMTWAFYQKYCDEAFALLSVEMLKAGKSPAGFDLAQLQADLKAL